MVLLAAAVAHHHLPVFLAATAISGAGYSLLFFSVNSAARPSTAAACSRQSICWLMCRWVPSRSFSARWRPRTGSVSPSTWRGRDRSVQRDHGRFGRDDPRRIDPDCYSVESEGQHVVRTTPEQNKALVLEAFDTLFNKRDYDAASRFWSDKYTQHSAHIEPGREGLFNLIKASPASLKYEPGLILAEGDFVIVHGRFSGIGLRELDCRRHRAHCRRVLAEHWDVSRMRRARAESKSGLPMFGDSFTG